MGYGLVEEVNGVNQSLGVIDPIVYNEALISEESA